VEQNKQYGAPLNNIKRPQVVFRNDPTTWSAAPNNQEGILGHASIFTERAMLNRQNENLYKVHCALYGTKDLMVNQDRYGFFTPTENIAVPQQNQQKKDSPVEYIQLPQRKTVTNLHLDMNPWNYVQDEDDSYAHKILNSLRYKRHSDFIIENNEVGCIKPQYKQLHIQSLVNLIDNYEEDGGFQIVPGFHNHIMQWTEVNKHQKSWYGNHQTFIMLKTSCDLVPYSIRVTARAGSMILWNQTVAHGSRCNNSHRFRMAQFFKVFVRPNTVPEALTLLPQADNQQQQQQSNQDDKIAQQRALYATGAKLRLDARRQVVAQLVKQHLGDKLTAVGKQLFDLLENGAEEVKAQQQ